MRTRKIKTIAILLSLAFLATVTALLHSHVPPNPITHGKHVSGWLDQYNPLRWVLSDDAQSAIRDTGTNAVPALLRMVLYRDSRLKQIFKAIVGKQKLIRFHFVDADRVREQGIQGFLALGPAGKVALPALLKAFNEPAPMEVRCAVATSLGCIGPDAREAVPTLLSALSSTNDLFRIDVLWSLAKIHQEPGLVIPALIKHLSDPSPSDWENACFGLAAYGPLAIKAVPALKAARDPSSPLDKICATYALQQIDSQTTHFDPALTLQSPKPRCWISSKRSTSPADPPSEPAFPGLNILELAPDTPPKPRSPARALSE